LIDYFIGNISAKNVSKSVHVCLQVVISLYSLLLFDSDRERVEREEHNSNNCISRPRPLDWQL